MSGKSQLKLKNVKSEERPSIPASFQGDPVIWAAWLYFQDGLTQGEIADIIGVSRPTVINYLNQAKENGIVEVSVRPAILSQVKLASTLRERFSLNDVLIVPNDQMGKEPYERIGQAAALQLLSLLRDGDVLGIAWGRTVMALANALSKAEERDVTVAQIIGGLSYKDDLGSEKCSALIAEKLNARCVTLHVPAIVSKTSLKDMLLKERVVKEQFSIIRSCTKVLVGVCTVKSNSLILGSGLVDQKENQGYVKKGAVGVISGRYFDIDGNSVVSELDKRLMGLTLDEIKQIPLRIGVAGGNDKIEAIIGALNGGYVNLLITDEATAEKLVDFN